MDFKEHFKMLSLEYVQFVGWKNQSKTFNFATKNLFDFKACHIYFMNFQLELVVPFIFTSTVVRKHLFKFYVCVFKQNVICIHKMSLEKSPDSDKSVSSGRRWLNVEQQLLKKE